jgi:hypothetical protein
MEQGTQEWLDARCGLLTASNVKQVLTPTLKVANNEKTRAYIYEIAAQRILNYVEPQFETFAMHRGHVDEVYARDMYNELKAANGQPPAVEVGFITETIDAAPEITLGYSPDGVVGDDGLIEIKSRAQKHQMKTIVSGEVPAEFMLQLQTGLLVTDRKWIDFVSYCGGMPLFVKRVYPCEKTQQAIIDAACNVEVRVSEFLQAYAENSMGMPIAERHDYNEHNDGDFV